MSGTLQLPRRLAAADYRLELRVTDGQRTGAHRLAVSLVRTLAKRRALALARRTAGLLGTGENARDDPYLGQTRLCRRLSAKAFACAARVLEPWGDQIDVRLPRRLIKARCVGRILVRLRRDGARAYPVLDPAAC